ncbi:hypothetical protein OHA72_17995 [Dactylosporangium sp. NBC_01737]|uniref:hypothetical protein n=1 Tax=Dactylosporangium sp. NBC_01737 TaxID=2975959 RepID=UPI002E155064|nr:hypothetical protein OHA72_17995 [Dactylosporangium sp. NBC_01737]
MTRRARRVRDGTAAARSAWQDLRNAAELEVRVGASGWDYLVPFHESVAVTLQRLRAGVLAEGDYYWPDGRDRPKPATEDELWADESVRESMTHSILDIFQVGTGDPADRRAFGRTFEVTDAECARFFGTARPTADDLARLEPDPPEALNPLLTDRGVGRHLIVYADGGPDQIYFFGCSGD